MEIAMSNKECKEARRQLDEFTLAELAVNSLDHVTSCADCSEFRRRQMRLRQLVGNLGVVNAPADFDYKLRARIAQAETTKGSGFSWFEFSALRAGLLAAGILLAVTVSFIGFNKSANVNIPSVAIRQELPTGTETVSLVGTVDAARPATFDSNNQQEEKPIKRYVATQTNNKRLATADFSKEAAPVFAIGPSKQGGVFPITTSGQPLRISVEDGSGNARVITVPTVSFGSQRVMSNQYVSKGSNW
jgi:hypothetical protein